jgi:anti-anti-sigma factor
MYTLRMEQFSIEPRPGGCAGVRILRLSGPFTLGGVFDFQAVSRAVTDPILVVDLSQVPYMDSAALGSILGLHCSCERNHRRYALSGVNDRVRTLFEVGGVDNLLIQYATAEEAEQGLAKAATAG